MSENTTENLYEKFWDSIREYLTEKFTDCPASAIEEATATICYKALFLVENQLRERDKQWAEHVRHESDRVNKELRNMSRQIRRSGSNTRADDDQYTDMKGEE